MTWIRWPMCGLALAITAGIATAQPGKALQLKLGEDDMQWRIGNDLVTRYHLHGFPRPIFWPVNAPGGLPLTRAWPMVKTIPPGGSKDHIHQKSLWFCHGDVIPEGIDYQAEDQGRRGRRFLVRSGGPRQDRRHQRRRSARRRRPWRARHPQRMAHRRRHEDPR